MSQKDKKTTAAGLFYIRWHFHWC